MGTGSPWNGQRGITVARLGTIRVVVAPSWFLSLALIAVIATPIVQRFFPRVGIGGALGVAVLLAVLLAVSVLAHELGHCAAAKVFRIPVHRVQLQLLGGVSELSRPPSTPREEAVIAAAGPVVSAGAAVAFGGAGLMTAPGSIAYLVTFELMLANAVVAVFNILPALPLDGGRVLRAAVWRLTGRIRSGTTAAAVGGIVIAAALAVAAVLSYLRPGPNRMLQALILAVLAWTIGRDAWASLPRRRR